MRSDRLTTAILLLGPAGLLGGALAFEYIGGLVPCEMCLWQRWALAAIAACTAESARGPTLLCGGC